MAVFDFSIKELWNYKPERNEPTDFDEFWSATLSEARQFPLNARFIPIESGLKPFETFDVTYSGFGNQVIKGWFIMPRQKEQKVPCVIEYMGYTGGRGFLTDWLLWPSLGFAVFVMDIRGQGSSKTSHGDTADLYGKGGNPSTTGFMTQGILEPEHYYFRRVFIDAVRAIEAACSYPYVDSNRICVTGSSQGGGITIAVAGLVPEINIAMPDVPFLCHYRRAVDIVDTFPYQEISFFCSAHRDKVSTVFHTLSYFDGVNFAARARAKAMFSVGLMDTICPPSSVFAAFNHWGGDQKDIRIYEFNGHEGGCSFQIQEKIKFLKESWSL